MTFAQQRLNRRVLRRKQRFIVCACCRLLWRYLDDSRSRRAVQVGERFASGCASATELNNALRDAEAAATEHLNQRDRNIAWAAAQAAFPTSSLRTACDVAVSGVVSFHVSEALGPYREEI